MILYNKNRSDTYYSATNKDNTAKPIQDDVKELTFPREFYGRLVVLDKYARGQYNYENYQYDSLNQNFFKIQKSAHRSEHNLSDTVTLVIKGSPANVSATADQLSRLYSDWKNDISSNPSRYNQEVLHVEERYVGLLMAEKRVLMGRFGVRMQHVGPSTDDLQSNERPEEKSTDCTSFRLLSKTFHTILLHGRRDGFSDARNLLEDLLTSFSTFSTEILTIPQKVHGLLIGVKGNNLRKIEQEFSVIIEFPPRKCDVEFADDVIVMGAQEKVENACESLISWTNDYLDKHREMYNSRIQN